MKVSIMLKKSFLLLNLFAAAGQMLHATPESPINFKGCKNKDIYLTQIDNYNYLTWAAPDLGPQPVSYEIFRANFTNDTLVLVATVSGSGILEYYDHDRDPSINDEYVIYALDASGFHSVPTRTTVTENCN